MHLKYLHYYGNESSESLLEAYGIMPKGQQIDQIKPKQCPNCSEPNKPDSKFCANCRMVLTYDAYSETVEEKHSKEKDVESLKEDIILLKEAIVEMQQLLKNPKKLVEISQS
jgi:integrase/recombinase XerD